jgi:hypothetical protein
MRERTRAVTRAVAAATAMAAANRQMGITPAAEAAIISTAAAEAAEAEVARTLTVMNHMQLMISAIEKMEIANEVSKVLSEEATKLTNSVEILLKNV